MAASVRFARQGDLEALEGLEESADALFRERFGASDWPPATPGPARAAAPGFLLVAEAGELAGFAHVVTHGELAHLEQLAVLPAHGRQGIGTALLRAAMDEARRRGFARLTLRTFADLAWNAPFYARHGFAEERPGTPFHASLVKDEGTLGSFGRRIQMGIALR